MEYTELVEHMKQCGWEVDDASGLVEHKRLGLVQPTWMDAIKACIEVASEA